jgi:release factor glutamine methyltransferase
VTTRRLTADAVAGRLRSAGCIAPEEEAEEIIAAAGDDDQALATCVERRAAGEPLAWVTGSCEFCGHRVHVDAGVYVPRPQSEELARRAGAILAPLGPRARAADLCTGAGPVAVHLRAATQAGVVAVDTDPRAVACARRNGVIAVLADLGRPLAGGAFDVVTAVAPYVPTDDMRFLPADSRLFEPRASLDGGPDGLRLVRRVLTDAGRLLRAGGWALVEVGGDQDEVLAPLLAEHGFDRVVTWHDEDSDLRGLAARLAVPGP